MRRPGEVAASSAASSARGVVACPASAACPGVAAMSLERLIRRLLVY
jgi:hypothetical protein